MTAALTRYLLGAMGRKFEWGVHDCATFVIGWAECLSGAKAVLRPLPKTERGFLRRQAGMRHEAEQVLGALGFLPAHDSAQDGDIGFTSVSSLVIFEKGFWHGVNDHGLTLFRDGQTGMPAIVHLWRSASLARMEPA